MKRICLFLLPILLIIVAGCAINSKSSVTVDSILKVFDSPNHFKQEYNSEQIGQISEKLSLEDDIKEIVHILDQSTGVQGLEWTYVYEFVSEKDAISFEENRTQYVGTIENGKCVRFGNIVVFGNSDLIDTIGG